MDHDVLWDGPRPATRGPKPTLTLDRVVAAGIAIADAEGLTAVAMHRVAADLGVTKMSLYRYVAGKAELVALMVEQAVGAPPPLPAGAWREALTTWARALLARYLAHPWALEATVGPRPVGPVELGWMESALGALAGTPLRGPERLDAVAVLAGHVRALVQQSTAAEHPEAALAAAIAAPLARHGERFPQLLAALAETAETGAGDQAFEFGLALLLDGLAARVGE
ncbi:TetR/AcrR family transcriptional regulator [Dactylosporangium sp. AC04546]|uniref:TetR/AcrR family transcriptional regulator n=1 Tax=Dactylosporangium sp. AC04546 TaxID=2862460 RepID=UPI001EDCCB25|nr:TetR/AcrR family transcriptional regulator [Dactylosporangium sp. AC04546]WVK80089.1 TetR/AcrR family transcriptional regulator [Dactylosporangium sp. AC04546]